MFLPYIDEKSRLLYLYSQAAFLVRCVQQSWTALMGESPILVIAKEPGSESQCVAEMRGAKREDKVPATSREGKDADRNIK